MTNDKLFESIASNLNIGICVYDPKGNFVYVNPKMIQWRKISYQQYLSMNVHDFFKDGRVEDCIFDRVMNTRAAVTRLQYYQEWKPQTSEKKRLRLVSGVPIFDSSGNICNVITYLQDIEEYNEKLMKLCSHAGDIMLVKAPQKYEDTALSGQNSIIAESIAMRDVLKQARNVASTDAAVILYGESGTGKQVIAEYIFENSLRKFKPFVEVNCAAFAENLLESELFGYEKGSFTGALNSGKKGLVEAADGGTLFLDEVNSLPMSLQGKFLHLIEKKSFRRVGSNKTQYADFRLISATNMDLKKMVDDNTFRADLYYRLNVLPLHIPPLRDRKEDIIPLCNYFITLISERYGIEKCFSDAALEQLSSYDWPGNVRELKNLVERVVIMTAHDSKVIENVPTELLLWTDPTKTNTSQRRTGQRRILTREIISAALTICHGNRENAAKYLGISRRTLQYKIREFGLPHKMR